MDREEEKSGKEISNAHLGHPHSLCKIEVRKQVLMPRKDPKDRDNEKKDCTSLPLKMLNNIRYCSKNV